jgi:hypothetical protein
MRSVLFLFLCLLTFTCEAHAQEVDTGDLSITFGPAKGKNAVQVRDTLSASPEFQSVISALNEVLILPGDLKMQFKECGGRTPLLDRQVNSATLCYEDVFTEAVSAGMTPEDIRQETLQAGLFDFLHGLGRLLIDRLGIPVTGSPVQAADEFATMISLLAGDALDTQAMQGIGSFALDASQLDPGRRMLTDEPVIDAPRARQIACLIYGGDPAHFGALVGPEGIREEKARTCEAEFNAKLLAWSQLLEPHLKQ